MDIHLEIIIIIIKGNTKVLVLYNMYYSSFMSIYTCIYFLFFDVKLHF